MGPFRATLVASSLGYGLQLYRDEKKCSSIGCGTTRLPPMNRCRRGICPKSTFWTMFPYPSGSGLHVGHPEGYTATDIVLSLLSHEGVQRAASDGLGRLRASAEQYAVKNRPPPAPTTEENIATSAGRSRCWASATTGGARSIPPIPNLTNGPSGSSCNMFNSYFDPIQQKPCRSNHLLNEW